MAWIEGDLQGMRFYPRIPSHNNPTGKHGKIYNDVMGAPILYFPFNQNYNQAKKNIQPVITNGNYISISNDEVFGKALYGSATSRYTRNYLTYNNSAQYLNIGQSQFTICFFLAKNNTNIFTNDVFYSHTAGDFKTGCVFYVDGGKNTKMTFRSTDIYGNNHDLVSVYNLFSDTDYHFWTVQRVGNTITMYLDLQYQNSLQAELDLTATNDAIVGYSKNWSYNGFSGKMAHLSIYNRALSMYQLQKLYSIKN